MFSGYNTPKKPQRNQGITEYFSMFLRVWRNIITLVVNKMIIQ